MKNLIIVGAGGFGREVAFAAEEMLGYGENFTVKGFLDARSDALDGFVAYPPIIGDVESYEIKEDDVFITALGDRAAREKCVKALVSRGAKFITIIHKSASIGKSVAIGEGSIVLNNVVITVDSVVGDHTYFFQNVTLGHDARIGSFVSIYAQSALGGGVSVESGASIFPGARIVPRRKIGRNAVVGIGSVVFLNVPDESKVFGNPAVVID